MHNKCNECWQDYNGCGNKLKLQLCFFLLLLAHHSKIIFHGLVLTNYFKKNKDNLVRDETVTKEIKETGKCLKVIW